MGVALHVGLGQHVESILVAQVVEHGVVGVVAGAHGIDVQPLHGLNVFFYLLVGDGSSVHGAEVMAVHAVEHHSLAVDGQGSVVADAHFAEAHLTTSQVDGVALCVLQRQYEVVQFWCLGTPLAGIAHVQVETQLCRGGFRSRGNSISVVLYAHFHHAAAQRLCSRQAHLHVGFGIGVGGIQVGGEEVVAYLALRGSPEEAVALYARESPIVLTL